MPSPQKPQAAVTPPAGFVAPLDPANADPVRVTLSVIEGPHLGRTFTFEGHDTFLVGRSKRAHFQLTVKDKYFSRIHFMVEVNPPQCRIHDMRSRNGTHVNGKRVQMADLHDGDLIRAGHTTLRVSMEGVEPPMAQVLPDSFVSQSTIDYVRPAADASLDLTAAFALIPAAGGACRVCAAKATGALCTTCQQHAKNTPQIAAGLLLVRKLGEGGMGSVYQALRRDGTLVAVKTIAPAKAGNKNDIDRFLREAGILGQLHHVNIVAFHEMGETQGQLFFVMEYVAGTDAKRLLETSGPMAVDRVLHLGRQLLEALEHAHGQGFVHRDIKPANLLVSGDADRELLKLADFGLARVYQASNLSGLSLTGDVGGTTAFIAPEQITNFREAKPAVDQYGAAATLYNLLTGQYLFDMPANFQEQLMMILENEPVPIRQRRPAIPEGLAALIHKGLAKDPSRRFADVRAMRRALIDLCY